MSHFRRILPCVLAVAIVLAIGFQEKPAERPAGASSKQTTQPAIAAAANNLSENSPGWNWVVPPIELAANDWPEKAIELEVGIYQLRMPAMAGNSADIEFVAGHPISTPPAGIDYQMVIIDGEGRRSVHTHRAADANGERVLHRFTIKREADAKHVGFERIDMLGRKVISDLALADARTNNVATLPYPALNEPYVFKLTDMDGKVIDSADLLGKVVLIDGWATWNRPSVDKMRELSMFRRKHQADGFEVIGINLDKDLLTLRKGARQRGALWQHVHVPADKRTRDIWERVSTIQTVPRMLILNRKGVLVADVTVRDLFTKLEEAVQEGAATTTAPVSSTQPAKP